jgi:hypothetical protein
MTAAQQMIYTSCPVGLSGSDGFQVQAATSDLAYEDRLELESTPPYRPPATLPPNPTPRQIRDACPPSLFARVLRSSAPSTSADRATTSPTPSCSTSPRRST